MIAAIGTNVIKARNATINAKTISINTKYNSPDTIAPKIAPGNIIRLAKSNLTSSALVKYKYSNKIIPIVTPRA